MPKIHEYNSCNNNGLAKLIYEGYLSLALEHGLDEIGGHYSYKALVINSTVPVAIMTYSVSEDQNQIFIHLSYVKPSHRRTGFHTLLFNRLVEIAREKKISRILSGTSASNKIMRKVAKKQRREENAVTLSFKVT
jgi:GNAT superfamily N-acetyltransferase